VSDGLKLANPSFRGGPTYDIWDPPDLVSLNQLVGFEMLEVYRLKNGELVAAIDYEAVGQVEFHIGEYEGPHKPHSRASRREK
jgi:hypothetical protein